MTRTGQVRFHGGGVLCGVSGKRERCDSVKGYLMKKSRKGRVVSSNVGKDRKECCVGLCGLSDDVLGRIFHSSDMFHLGMRVCRTLRRTLPRAFAGTVEFHFRDVDGRGENEQVTGPLVTYISRIRELSMEFWVPRGVDPYVLFALDIVWRKGLCPRMVGLHLSTLAMAEGSLRKGVYHARRHLERIEFHNEGGGECAKGDMAHLTKVTGGAYIAGLLPILRCCRQLRVLWLGNHMLDNDVRVVAELYHLVVGSKHLTHVSLWNCSRADRREDRVTGPPGVVGMCQGVVSALLLSVRETYSVVAIESVLIETAEEFLGLLSKVWVLHGRHVRLGLGVLEAVVARMWAVSKAGGRFVLKRLDMFQVEVPVGEFASYGGFVDAATVLGILVGVKQVNVYGSVEELEDVPGDFVWF